jgi:hypothetical protein
MDTRRIHKAQTFEHKIIQNADGTRLRVRRNGKTRTWKRDTSRFEIPVKYGLYEYYIIDNTNHTEWVITG